MEYRKDDIITLCIDDMGIDGAGIGTVSYTHLTLPPILRV